MKGSTPTLAGLDLRDPYKVALSKLGPWIPVLEFLVLRDSTEHVQIVDDMLRTIEAMPSYGQTEGGDAVVQLHYFNGSSDWYITEKGPDDDPTQHCFGWVVLNGDLRNAELGAISVEELVARDVELDLHWQARPLKAVIRERGGRPLVW